MKRPQVNVELANPTPQSSLWTNNRSREAPTTTRAQHASRDVTAAPSVMSDMECEEEKRAIQV